MNCQNNINMKDTFAKAKATSGYASTQEEADRFNRTNKPFTLKFYKKEIK